MIIRKFQKRDAEQCSKMIIEIINKSRNLIKQAKENIKRDSTPRKLIEKSKSREYFVCEKNRKIIGIGGLKKKEVIRMYTSIEHQSQGIGTPILKRIEKEAKKNKIKKLFLYTHPRASKFYLKNNFVINRKFKDKGMRVVYMEKKLKCI